MSLFFLETDIISDGVNNTHRGPYGGVPGARSADVKWGRSVERQCKNSVERGALDFFFSFGNIPTLYPTRKHEDKHDGFN